MWVAINGLREWGKSVSTPPPVATPPGASSGRKRGSLLFTTLQSVQGRPFSSTSFLPLTAVAVGVDGTDCEYLTPAFQPPTHSHSVGPRASGSEPKGETMGTQGEREPPSFLWFIFRPSTVVGAVIECHRVI